MSSLTVLRDALLLVTVLAVIRPAGVMAAGDVTPLAPSDAVERPLEAEEEHTYRVEPADREAARLVVEQLGVDVEISVEAADGDGFVADGPFDRRGWETVLLAGSASFQVTLRGREVGAPPGRYRLRLESLDSGTADGERRLAAARAATAAARLYYQGTVEAWREAAVHHQRATVDWLAAGDETEAARDLYAQAVLERLVDEPAAALETAREAVERFRHLADPLLESFALNELGLNHWTLGSLDAARQAFADSAELVDVHGDAYIAAAVASNLCLMDLSSGALAAGRACYQRSLPTIEGARAAQIESAARINLGRIAEHLGEPEEALEHYRRALEIQVTGGDRRGQARTLSNLGVLLSGLGELDAAMARYAEAVAIIEEIGDPRWLSRVLSNIGYAYRSVGEPRRASISFERALELSRQAGDRRGEAATLDNLGLVRRDLGQPDEALDFHLQALDLRRQDGQRQGEALTLRRLAEAYSKLGQQEDARARLGEAVTLAGELGDRQNEAVSRQALGEIHLRRGEIEDARQEFGEALRLVADSGLRKSEAKILYGLARVEHAGGRSQAARRHLAAALEKLEVLRAEIDSPDLRTSHSSLQRSALELDVDLLMEAHRTDLAAGYHLRALEAAERARARTLVELFLEADVDLTAGADPQLLARRRSLVRRLDAKVERLADPKLDAGSRTILEADQQLLLQRLEVLDAKLREGSLAYGELVRPRALSAAEIQGLTGAETVLAVFLLGDSKSYLWRVTAAAVDVFELPARRSIEDAARRLHVLWSELRVEARSEDVSAAVELAGMLRLEELAGKRRLAVIADGALHLVPFAALPVPAGEPDGPLRPLAVSTEVVSLPSASVLALDRRRHREEAAVQTASESVKLAILADPVFGPDYPRLPGSRAEAEAIVAVSSPETTLTAFGFEADLELLEDGRLRDYDVLHIATHGVIDAVNPALSGLVLSQVDAGGQPRRGFLRLHDVFGLRLDAELVVLSGCRTALGPVVRGEGLIGLARGFMHAGSRRVLASLWPVEDRATSVLMTHFYRAMWDQGSSPAAALAMAQRELASTRRHRDPYYWAGFVLLGDWR